MADGEQEIDKLSIAISVKGATEKQTANINEFAKALTNLNNALPQSLLNKLNDLSKLSISLGKLKGLSNVSKAVSSVSKEKANQNTNNGESPLPLNNDGKATPLTENMTKLQKLGKGLNFAFSPIINKTKTLFGLFKRVVLYRAIRALTRQISVAFADGIKNLAYVDKSANKTMSSITTALQQIKNALGMVIMPVLEMAEPMITSISKGLAVVANKISEINAGAKGLATYTKLSDKYIKDFKQTLNTGSSFSFDSFTSLGTSPYDMFENIPEKMGLDEATTKLNGIKAICSAIIGLFVGVQAIKSLKAISDITGAISLSASGIGATLLIIIGAITSITSGINMIINGFDWVSFGTMCAGLLAVAVGIGLALGLVPGLIAGVVALVVALVALVVANWDEIDRLVIQPISDFFCITVPKWFTQDIPNWFKGIGEWWDQYVNQPIVKFFTEDIPNFFKETLPNKFSEFIETIKNTLVSVLKWMNTNIWEPIGNVCKSLFEGIINWFIDRINDIGHINIKGLKLGDWQVWDDVNVKLWDIPPVKLAKGGVVDQGTEFIAGEAGAEIVHDMGGGKTGVTNVDQIKQAMIEAIYESNLIQSIQESGNIYLDNEKVGESVGKTKSLRRQINRTNPMLNLK